MVAPQRTALPPAKIKDTLNAGIIDFDQLTRTMIVEHDVSSLGIDRAIGFQRKFRWTRLSSMAKIL